MRKETGKSNEGSVPCHTDARSSCERRANDKCAVASSGNACKMQRDGGGGALTWLSNELLLLLLLPLLLPPLLHRICI